MATYSEVVARLRAEQLANAGIDITNQVAVDNYWNTNYQAKWDIEEEARMAIEDEEQDLTSQYDSVANIFTKADRILSNQDMKVVISLANKDMEVVANNNGSVINMNPNLLDDVNAVSAVGINGVNYHELAHALFSPRAGSELGQWVMETDVIETPAENSWEEPTQTPKYLLAFNTLEEGRIESLLTAKYPSTRLFLEVATTTYAITEMNPDDLAHAFYITRGRRHLDLALRQRIADLYVAKYGIEQADAVADIIDEYRTLSFPADSNRAKTLISRMYHFVGHKNPSGSGNGCGERPVMKKGRPIKNSEQKRLQNEARDGEPDTEDLRESDTKSDNIKNSEVLNGDLNSDKAGYQAGESEGQEITINQRSYDDLNDVIALINERADFVSKLPQVKSETKTLIKAVSGEGFGNNLNRDTLFNYSDEIDSKFRYASNQFGTELERLRVDNDPEWEREKPSGRLNIPRTMNSSINDLPRLFDKWSQGNDNCDIEAVIMLDRSGSMYGDMYQASGAVWAMKRGLERIDASVNVLTFNHTSRTLYTDQEKAKPNQMKVSRPSGGTDPVKGLRTSLRLFRASTKPTKLLFVVTDGWWSNERENDLLVKTMKEEGVTVCVVYLGQLYNDKNASPEQRKAQIEEAVKKFGHGAHHFTAIGNPADLVNVARKVVKEQLSPAKR